MSAQKGVIAVVGGFVTILVGMYLTPALATATDSANQSTWIDPSNASLGIRYADAGTVYTTVPVIFAVGLLIAGIVMIIFGALAIKN